LAVATVLAALVGGRTALGTGLNERRASVLVLFKPVLPSSEPHLAANARNHNKAEFTPLGEKKRIERAKQKPSLLA
jgi:hypothetical protein